MSAHGNLAAHEPQPLPSLNPNLLKSSIAESLEPLKGNCHIHSCCHDQNVTSSRVTTEKLTDIINLMNKNYEKKKTNTPIKTVVPHTVLIMIGFPSTIPVMCSLDLLYFQ